MDYLKELHELCKTVSEAISEVNAKIKAANGKLTTGDMDYIDKLTHALKSIKATIKMVEEEEEPQYSGRSYGMPAQRWSGRSRDSMGRYSGERGYSRTGLADELYSLMQSAPDEGTRRDFERLINRIEYRD